MADKIINHTVVTSIATVVVWGCIALTLQSCISRFQPKIAEYYAPKTGVVIDAETGQPIADAFIIAEGLVRPRPDFSGTYDHLEYRIVVRSEKNGSFKVPATPAKVGLVEINWRGDERRWTLAVVEPGYLAVGDEDSIPGSRSPGGGRISPPSSNATPSHRFLDGTVEVSPLKLKKTELSISQQVAYALAFEAHSHTYDEVKKSPATEDLMKASFFDSISNAICAASSGDRLDTNTVGDVLTSMSPDKRLKEVGMKTLQQLEPEGFRQYGNHLGFENPGNYSSFATRDVCEAISAAIPNRDRGGT